MSQVVHAIGMMSGTSLDGLDLCYVKFFDDQHFEILHAETLTYPNEIYEKLKSCYHWPAADLLAWDIEFGYYLGEMVNWFISQHQIEKLDFVASHGQTIFHQPDRNFTLQIGHGAAIRSKVDVPVICDFRTQDVILGGQGAPLVPIGDELLFGQFDSCLNLGGFSNISFKHKNKRIAFDICPVNLVLNHYAEKLGQKYDVDGDFARKGKIHEELLSNLNQLEYYQMNFPKSLGFESVEKIYLPIIENFSICIEDKLKTFVAHIQFQIEKVLTENSIKSVLVSGGGARNKFLIESLNSIQEINIIIPEEKIIDFKEALIFAFLGKLRFENKVNCLSSVTGAKHDHSSGVIYI